MRSGGGFFFTGFVMLGIIVMLKWVLLVIVGVIAATALLMWGVMAAARMVDRHQDRRLAIEARADQQHAWVMAGDDRGIYGMYPPAAVA